MAFFLVAVGLLLLAAPLSLLAGTGTGFREKSALVSLLAGCITGIVAVFHALAAGGISTVLPWSVPVGAFALRLDGLAAVFLLPAFLLIGAGAIYGEGYWPRQRQPAGGTWVRFFYAILAAAIVMVLAADNAILFLLAWECMAMAGYFLVCTERHRQDAQEAGFLYFACTHTGTLILFGLFALLHVFFSGPVTLPPAASLDAAATAASAVFLLALTGFGLKAGIIPLHIWLPRAHAAAPSHVSALMSGVMIKTGIYGIMRVTSFFTGIPAWWGWTVLGLGLVSAVLGVVFAIAQHDIKRLLAYHSVENIGIILLGFGTALLGLSFREPALFTLGMAGALLHVINHGLFKGLLFLSAGSIIHATGSRELLRYGGLLRHLPLTGFFFLGGAVAICGLPPLNGFVSEWFVYLGLLQAGNSPIASLTLAVLALPALALTGGLALLCFAKVFGLTFLGAPRAPLPAGCHEAPASMLAGMAILLAACLWIGLLPSTMVPLLTDGLAAWPAGSGGRPVVLATLAPAANISVVALLLLLLVGVITLFFVLPGRKAAARGMTWGCGFPFVDARMQYSVSSFAQIINDLFGWALRTRRQGETPKGLFPEPVRITSHAPDAVLDLLVLPVCRRLAVLADRIRHVVQHGNLNLYVLYLALALCLLLWQIVR